MTGHGRQRWHTFSVVMLLGLVTHCPPVAGPACGCPCESPPGQPEPNAVLQQPPTRVILWFSGRIAPDFSAIQVLDAQGQRLDHDDTAVDQEDAGPGGHPAAGAAWPLYGRLEERLDGRWASGAGLVRVRGGRAAAQGAVPTPSPPLFQSVSAPVLRGLVLLSTLAVVGGLGFVLLVSRALLAGRTPGDPVQHVGTHVVARTVRISGSPWG